MREPRGRVTWRWGRAVVALAVVMYRAEVEPLVDLVVVLVVSVEKYLKWVVLLLLDLLVEERLLQLIQI